MAKKLTLACMALVAFAAFVLPATASAANDPQLTDGAGGFVSGKVRAHNVNGSTIFYNTAKTIEQVVCTTATMTGEITKNKESTVEGSITSSEFSGTGAVHADNGLKECTGSFGSAYITVKNLPLTIKSTPAMVNDEFQVTGPAGANVKFLIGSTTAGECEYEGTNALKGDYTTGTSATNDSVLTVRDNEAGSGSKLIRGGFLCPTSGLLHMSFTLETDTATTEGIWVS
jgi:hypothetical protein